MQFQNGKISYLKTFPRLGRLLLEIIGRLHLETYLIALQELLQRPAGRIKAIADHRRPRRGRLVSDFLQTSNALSGEKAHFYCDFPA